MCSHEFSVLLYSDRRKPASQGSEAFPADCGHSQRVGENIMIDEKRIADFFAELVSIDSPSLEEREMADTLKANSPKSE